MKIKWTLLLHVNGHRLLPLHAVDFFALEDSLYRDGTFFIFTCNDRVPGCRKFTQGVQVGHTGTVITWTHPDPPPWVLAFEADLLRDQFRQAQKDCNRMSRE